MGKTTLTRHLQALAAKEFQGRYQTVLIDWDRQKDLNVALQRGHSNIEPQAILDILHKELKQSLKAYSGESYSDARQKLQQIEADVEQALASEPPNTELKEVTAQYGGKAIAWILQKSTEGMISVAPTGAAVAIKVGATLLSQARQLAAKSLNKEDVEIFQQPLETLVAALGKDIAKATQRQPTVIFLDTYEVVDRRVCDYALRQVIQQGGKRVIWSISGRSNLAKSGKRGDQYFRGYGDDFSEAQIYPRELLQFSFREIQEYFEKKVPDSSLTESEAEAIAEFSLGIPFVVDLAAVMCSQGKPVAEIVAPVPSENGESNDRDQVIKETCERFLKHCLYTPETLPDRQLTFALAMLRRSQTDLLGAMVDAPTGLRERLKTLQGRYAFLAEDEQRLDEKMANFMQDYLLQDLQRRDDLVQTLNNEAIAWLELQIEERQKTLGDTSEFLEDERLSGWMLDLAHHYGWRGEEALWYYLMPRFIEAWQYDRAWAQSLLKVATTFRRLLGTKQRKILSRMQSVLETTPDLGEQAALLETLEKWLLQQSLNPSNKQELQAILKLQHGYLCFAKDQYDDALNICLAMVSSCPSVLSSPLAKMLRQLAWKFSWEKGSAIPSEQGQIAAKRATELDAKDAANWVILGVAYHGLKQHEQAVEVLKKGLDISEEAYAINWLGNTYYDLKQYQEAIARYEKAIELDPSYATAYYNLGNTYKDLNQYQEAIALYEKVIELDPSYAKAYNNLGNTYKALKQYQEAITSYQKAIDLQPDNVYFRTQLGSVLTKQKQYEGAIASYQKAIELSPEYCYAHDRLGWVYLLNNQLDNAQQAFEKAIELDDKTTSSRFNLGITYAKQNNLGKAHVLWQQGLELITEDRDWSNITRAFYTFVIGNIEQGIADMQRLINAEVDVAAIEEALNDAEILVTCPQPPEHIKDMITLLRNTIAQKST